MNGYHKHKSAFQKRHYHYLQEELRTCPGLAKIADMPELLLCCERAHDKMQEKK